MYVDLTGQPEQAGNTRCRCLSVDDALNTVRSLIPFLKFSISLRRTSIKLKKRNV